MRDRTATRVEGCAHYARFWAPSHQIGAKQSARFVRARCRSVADGMFPANISVSGIVRELRKRVRGERMRKRSETVRRPLRQGIDAPVREGSALSAIGERLGKERLLKVR